MYMYMICILTNERETMTTLNINDPKYYDPFLKNLEQNTFNNYHTENCMMIVYNFGTRIQKQEMREIQKDHDQKGYLSSITSIARCYLLKDVLNNIDNKILANRIKARL